MGVDLTLIWALIIVFGVMMYVIMDGFDLGIGILYPFFPHKEDRDVMMNTVAPIWDGNETWLVLGGAGLLAAFPFAYSIVLSALYLPLMFMLLGLIFRGVAFEFRFKAHEQSRHVWDKAFAGGSIAAAFFQGVTLGAYLDGIKVVDRAYAGGALDWLTPFSVFTGLGLIAAYALLGSTWLIMKTEGALLQRMTRVARPLVWVLLAVIGVISVWTPLTHPAIAARWFTLPNTFWFAPVPILVALASYLLLRSLGRHGRADSARTPQAVGTLLQGAANEVRAEGSHFVPFLLTLAMIFLGYSGLGISLWPHIVPPGITIWDAAAPPQSQGFTLVGTLFILPLILGYTAWGYYVFRGKVTADTGYHH